MPTLELQAAGVLVAMAPVYIPSFVSASRRRLRGRDRPLLRTRRVVNLDAMNIEIRDPALQARLQKQVEATGSASVEEALQRLLETQEEQDRWLSENRGEINTKIRRGLDQLHRGEGVPEDQLDSYLARLKSKSE